MAGGFWSTLTTTFQIPLRNTNMSYKDLFPRFLITGDYADYLTRVFGYKGHVYACNHKCLIRIPAEGYDGDAVEIDFVPPEIDEMFSGLRSVSFPWPITRAELEEMRTHEEIREEEREETCSDCNGSGDVYWHYYSIDGEKYEREHTCPVCGGKGVSIQVVEIPTGKMGFGDSLVKIAGVRFECSSIDLLMSVAQGLDEVLMPTLVRHKGRDLLHTWCGPCEMIVAPTKVNEP